MRYYVDPSDDWGGTELTVSGVGPWIDCPDGVYSQKRQHKMYPLHIPTISCRTGEVVQETVKIKMPRPFSAQPPENGILGDSLLLILQFRGNDGKSWPWQHRVQLGNFQRKNFYFELDSPQPGHLFPYSSRIEMYVVPGPLAQNSGETRTLHWQVFQPDGKEVASGDMEFSATGGRQLIPISLPAGKRGTFRLRAAVDGWETRETTFATIPDLNAITQGKPTPFGGQKFAENREAVAAVRLLGMSFCRTWVKWSDVQPAPNRWNEEYLSELSESIDHMNETGIIPWILLYDPPAWAIDHPEGWSVDYTPFPFRDEQLVAVVHRLADMFRGKISGFEWLNEICPGKLCSDPVEEYIRFCRVATNTAKSVDPTFEIQAAGGLWPTSYRKSLLAGGLADHIDILPIHYGDSNSVEMARGDLKNYGVDLPIVDNETSLGLATWGMPLTTAIKDQTQSDYFFTRFPAELLAGCRKITVFGGEPDPAGNWTMFWGDMSPRPSAAALAVLISKLWNAKPVGEFSLGKGDSIKLFETPEKRAVMVVSSSARNGEKITLPAGSGELIVTDQQGNERTLKEAETHDLLLTASPYFVEGGNLDVLKAQLIVQPAAGNSSPGQRNYVLGHLAELPVTIANITGKKLNCKMELVQAPGEAAPIEIFELEPGKTIRKSFQFIPEKSGSFDCSIRVTFQTPGFPVVDKRCRLNVIQPESVGNLLKNPGFESGAEKSGMLPAYWRPSPGNAGSRFRFKLQNELGHGDWVFRFQGQEKHYISLFQTLNGPFLPGKYLYSCWIKSDSLQTGSNYSATAPGNKSINKHWLEVFQAPVTQPEWDIFSAIVEVPENAENVTCSPVCFGTGWSMIDNVLLTLYEGTEYVAFAPRGNKIVIDGKLDDFDRSAPIPLLGKSQLRTMSSSYEWSPETFSAVAYFNWDEQNLFLGIEVIDLEHNEGSVEAGCVTGDSVEVALHPQNRLPGEDDKAFLFQISSVVPGGSGKHTIFRPEQHSGGLKAGSLAKDSSIYDIVVRREGQKTCYEISMPWNDLGEVRGEFGTKLGLSLMLNDGNGTRKLASMVWGGGLFPVWNPASFGMLILTEAMP